jgi:hypothetical protein
VLDASLLCECSLKKMILLDDQTIQHHHP